MQEPVLTGPETLTTAYAVELCPVALRGYLTGFVVMAWNIGQFISAFGECTHGLADADRF